MSGPNEVTILVKVEGETRALDELPEHLQRVIAEIDSRIQRLGGALDKVMSSIPPGAKKAADGVKTVGDAAVDAGTKAERSRGLFDGWLGKLAKLGLATAGAGAILGLGQAAVHLGGDLVAGNAQLETYTTQLGTLMGSADAAQGRLAELSDFGAKTPFELPQLVEAEKVMIGFGLTTGKSMSLAKLSASDMRTVIGDVAAGTGKDFAEIALTFGKFSAGATGEGISRLQELGVVTREELAGVGVEFSKSGQLTSPLPVAFEAATRLAQQKFGGGMDALSNTFEGKMSTLADTWAQIKRSLAAPLFEVAKSGLDLVLPLLNNVSSGLSAFTAGFGAQPDLSFVERLQSGLASLSDTLGAENPIVRFADSAISAIQPLATAWGEFLAGFSRSDAGDLVGRLADGLKAIGGDDTPAVLVAIAGALPMVQAGFSSLLDVGGKVIAWLLQHKELVAAVVAALGTFSVISTVVGWIGGLIAAVGSASAAITAAGGVLTFVVGILGGPVTIAIGAVAALVAVFALAWKSNFGDIQGKVAAFTSWLQATLLPVVTTVFLGVQRLLAGLVAWWKEHGDAVMAVVSSTVGFIAQQFGFLIGIVTGIVKAGIALITGDWSGLGVALGQIAANAVNLVVGAFRGMLSLLGAIGNTLKSVLLGAARSAIDGFVSFLRSGAQNAGKFTIDGLVEGIRSGAGRAVSAIVDLAKSLIASFMSNLKIGSPSKVFEEAAMWIGLAIASGIAKTDRKVMESLASVVGSLNTMAGGLQEFASRMLKFVVPTDSQVADARAKFTRLLVIVQSFVKDFAYLGSLLPVANSSQASPAQKGLIDAVVRSKFGVGFDDLITGGEADWTTRLTDIISKVAAAWGTIAENLNKMSEAKLPSAGRLEELKAAAVGVILWAQEVTSGSPPNLVGASDFAEVIKSASDMLAAVAKIDLSKATTVTVEQLAVARSNVRLIGTLVADLVADWMTAGDEARTRWVAGVRTFADAVTANATILKAGDVGDLSKVTTLTADQTGIIRGNIRLIGTLVADLVADWMQAAETVHSRWVEGVKSYAEAVKASADILAAGASAKLADVTALDRLHLDTAAANVVLIVATATLLSADFRLAADDTQTQLADGTKRYAETVRAAADTLAAGGALDLSKATAVDVGLLNVAAANARALYDVEVLLSATFRELAADAQTQLTDGARRYAEVVKAAVDTLGVGAAIKLADVLEIDQVALNRAAENADLLTLVAQQLLDAFVAGGGVLKNLPPLSEAAKQYSDTVKATADVLGAGASAGKLADVLMIDQVALSRAASNADLLVFVMGQLVDAWTVRKADDQKALGEAAKRYADVVGSASKLFGDVIGLVSKLATLTNPADLSAKLSTVRTWVAMIWAELELVARDITADEAEARSAVATAVGTAAKGLADVAESMGKLMALASGDLFAPDAGRSDLGFMQRVRARRADFKASVLTDSIKRMVGALTSALATLNLPAADDPKIVALDALAGAFTRLAEALDKLGGVKLPDPKQLAAVLAAASLPLTIPLPVAATSAALAGARGGPGAGGSITNQVTVYFRPTVPVTVQMDSRQLGEAVTMILAEQTYREITGPSGG